MYIDSDVTSRNFLTVFTPVPVRVPVPFHSFVLRSHLQKLTGPVPVAGL